MQTGVRRMAREVSGGEVQEGLYQYRSGWVFQLLGDPDVMVAMGLEGSKLAFLRISGVLNWVLIIAQ